MGAKTVVAVLDLGNGKPLPGPCLLDFWASAATARESPLVLLWDVRINNRTDIYDGSIFPRGGILACMDPDWAHYAYYDSALAAHTNQLRSNPDGIAATNAPSTGPAAAVPDDRFRDDAYSLSPGDYNNVTFQIYPTDDPTILINGKLKTCCPFEITTEAGEKLIAAVVDDRTFSSLPYKDCLGADLSKATKPQLMTLLGTNADILTGNLKVENKYDTSVITHVKVDKVEKAYF